MFALKSPLNRPFVRPFVFSFCMLASLVLLTNSGMAQETNAPLAESFLQSGQLTKGELALSKRLQSNPDDDQARFGLGVIQFVQSIEHLGTKLHHYGPTRRVRNVPFLRLPVEPSDTPQKVNYAQFRQIFEKMIVLLEKSENTLAAVKSKDVKLPLHVFTFHLDFNEDGKVEESENISSILDMYMGNRRRRNQTKEQRKQEDEAKKKLVIDFDYSDVQWLRGYSHALRAMCEFVLAHDQENLWDVIAHRVFEKGQVSFEFLHEETPDPNPGFIGDMNEILDVVAAIHNMNFKLIEPERMKKAHGHLKRTVAHSREMWKSILAETDHGREWIPNENQVSAVTATRITGNMTNAWGELLDEVDLLLDGKKLLPFWRGKDKTRGINLKRAFFEPRDFDLILWIHGSGAAPYLENGPVTDEDTWQGFQDSFGGNLFTFATWFN